MDEQLSEAEETERSIKMTKYEKMGRELRFMDTAMRYLNNENYTIRWLYIGVADGDADMMTDAELGEAYEDTYEEVREAFNNIMADASADAVKEDYELFCIGKKEWFGFLS